MTTRPRVSAPTAIPIRRPRSFARIGVFLLGLFWLFAGSAKMVMLLDPANDQTVTTWTSKFPTSLVAVAALTEIAIGLVVCCEVYTIGLLSGLGILAFFSVLLIVSPPARGQACGCGVPWIPEHGVQPLPRNAFLGALHVLALALVVPAPRRPR